MNRVRAGFIAAALTASFMPGPGPVQAAVPGLSFTQTGCEGYSDSVARLYTAGFDRVPEEGGFNWWMNEYTSGRWGLPRMASFFASSDEFVARYGALSNDGFVRQLYRNVLGREGESIGVIFWTDQMSKGMTRGIVLLRFAESPENIAKSGTVQPALGGFNSGITGAWPCHNPGDIKNCSDFVNRREAQAWFDFYFPYFGDVAKLDGDGNGLACESLPR